MKRGILPVILFIWLFLCMPTFARDMNSEFSLRTTNDGRVIGTVESTEPAPVISQGTAEEWFNKGVELYNQGIYDEAIKAFGQAITINPKYAEAWSKKGEALCSQGKYEEVIKACDEALKINPRYANAWTGKGAALYGQGKYDEAIKAYDQAISINPQLANAWSNKGVALYSQSKYDEAIKAYDQAISINPQSSDAWCNKGTALFAMGKYNESIEALDLAITIDSKNFAAWFEKGEVLYVRARESLSKKDDNSLYAIFDLLNATSCLDKSLELNSNNSIACSAWYQKGNIFAIFGRNNEAIDAYNAALKIDPTKSEIQEQKNRVLKALGQQ